MSFVFTAVVTTLAVLGIMIVIHELGHHLVAKAFGVRVEVFSVGFGKRLFGVRHKGTDYRLSALPFGGYVKMAGENPMDSRTGDPGEFMGHPRWQRVLIALAGPAMNILLAIAILTGLYMFHYEHFSYMEKPVKIGSVDRDSSAAKAGLQSGDVIMRFGDREDPTWEELRFQSAIHANQPVSVLVQRGEALVQTSITPVPVRQRGPVDIGAHPWEHPVVNALTPEMPAIKAGIANGDVIVAIDGDQIWGTPAVPAKIQAVGARPLTLDVLRDGKPMSFTITPQLDTSVAEAAPAYRLGISLGYATEAHKLSLLQAFEKSLETNKTFSFLILELLQKMATREVSMKQVDGPIGIGRAAGEAVQQPGWAPLLALTAMISLNLGIFNLLPIPILDGGLILLTTVEGIIRRDINQRVKERIYQTAFVFLVVFAVFVMYNDVAKLIWPG